MRYYVCDFRSREFHRYFDIFPGTYTASLQSRDKKINIQLEVIFRQVLYKKAADEKKIKCFLPDIFPFKKDQAELSTLFGHVIQHKHFYRAPLKEKKSFLQKSLFHRIILMLEKYFPFLRWNLEEGD